VNKRDIAKRAANSTPSALRTCSKSVIEKACTSLVPSDATTTRTITHVTTSPCTITDSETITEYSHTLTTKYIFSVSPPPFIIYADASVTLTTTIPADCAGPAYYPNSNGMDGDEIVPVDYPYFAQTDVECCLVCATMENCVASAFIDSGLDCQLLMRTTPLTGGNTSNMCPLGIEDYPFDMSEPDGNTFPGPCGY
jgi:hypothetical protein